MSVDFQKLVSGTQMAAIDLSAIDEFGIPSLELMERAGSELVEVIRDRWDGLEGLSVSIICGKGNNGGDGLVVGRLLDAAGVKVVVFLASPADSLKPDAARNLQRLEEIGITPQPFPSGEPLPSGGPLPSGENGVEILRQTDLIIDALLGIGVRGVVRPELAAIIDAMNESGRPIVSVDMPSGVDADSGGVSGVCVNASVTVTFGLAKLGQLLYPGRSFCGDLELADIGFPPGSIDACESQTYLISAEKVASLIPVRAADAHKGDCGKVAVVAGSVGMTGAAALAADSALLAGAGRVTLGVPASLNDIMEVKLTEVMTRPLPEVRQRRCLSLRSLGEIELLLEGSNCLAIGPGIGTYRETSELVRRLVSRQLGSNAHGPLPIVIDADGINAFVGFTDILKKASPERPVILTPHLGEFGRLANLDKLSLKERPIEHARDFATAFGVILVLKGAPTVVTLPDGRALLNPSGNAGMATAGSGDVLTGVLSALIAQGLPAPDAACVGVYLHGLAGDLAVAERGPWGLVASDIARYVPQALVETHKEEFIQS